jgi:hypothetical protein
VRTVFLALAIVLGLSGCRKHRVSYSPPAPPATTNTLVPGTVIKGAGTWTHFDGTTRYHLSAHLSGTRMEWRLLGSGPTGSGSAAASADDSSPWFIYVESPNRIWFHDGAPNVSCWTLNQGVRSEKSEAITNGTLQPDSAQIPAEVIPLLPADLQKLFPEAASKPRPSI